VITYLIWRITTRPKYKIFKIFFEGGNAIIASEKEMQTTVF